MFARGEANNIPEWTLDLNYAEQFGCHAQDVANVVNLKWWIRWQLWEQAKASKRAHEVAAQAEDWTKLPQAVLDLLKWAMDETDES